MFISLLFNLHHSQGVCIIQLLVYHLDVRSRSNHLKGEIWCDLFHSRVEDHQELSVEKEQYNLAADFI